MRTIARAFLLSAFGVAALMLGGMVDVALHAPDNVAQALDLFGSSDEEETAAETPVQAAPLYREPVIVRHGPAAAIATQ